MKLFLVIFSMMLSSIDVGGFIFAIMILSVVGIVDIRHYLVVRELRIKRLINDIESACEGTKITVVKYDI